MKNLLRLGVLFACAATGVALSMSLFDLPAPRVRLPEHVLRELHASGVEHPVTAVLLNFRGYDTLLEIAVLFLALLGVLLAREERKNDPRSEIFAPAVLQTMAKLTAPLMILVAAYLLWAGAHRPGGAFQAGAVLASGIVLLHLAGILPAWRAPAFSMRLGVTIGLLVFLGIAAALMLQGSLLQYPVPFAGLLILLIETCLTVSLALLLAALFLWQPKGENQA